MPLTLLRPFAARRAQLSVLLLLSVCGGRLHAQTAVTPGSDKLETVVIEATRLGGPEISPTGANDYAVTAQDINALPAGDTTAITDVLTHMPGVAIDQNQQIHIRNTEGPQFQYQINGVLIPLDINTNPPFISMINPLFIEHLDLLDGVLPSRFSYATGGVVSIQTHDGCEEPAGG